MLKDISEKVFYNGNGCFDIFLLKTSQLTETDGEKSSRHAGKVYRPVLSVSIVELLICRGAAVDSISCGGVTPLGWREILQIFVI